MKRTELLRRILANCYCQLRPSPIHGIGVFAIRDVPKGRNPFKTLPKYATTGFVRATEDELAALPPRLAALIRALFVPTAETMYVPTCGLNIIYLDTISITRRTRTCGPKTACASSPHDVCRKVRS